MLIISHCRLVLMLMFLTPTVQFYLARVGVIRKFEEKEPSLPFCSDSVKHVTLLMAMIFVTGENQT